MLCHGNIKIKLFDTKKLGLLKNYNSLVYKFKSSHYISNFVCL